MASDRQDKKYVAIKDGTKVHFGHPKYQQWKDSTGLGLYSHLDHNDPKRRANFISRHNCNNITNKNSAQYLACKYLW